MNSNPLVQFLRSYGPNPASDSLYDEHVQAASKAHGITEINMEAPLVDELGVLITGDVPQNVILTGTAGDGKTYHVRHIFVKHLGGNPEDWPGNELVVTVPLANGRELRIIRDLSELTDSKKDEEVDHITRCLAGRDDKTVYLVAANDGQLLGMWRRASELYSENALYARVYHALSEMLRQEDEADQRGFLKLRMINLSQRMQPDVIDEAINKILDHPMWDTGCEHCPLFSNNEESCPIRINRRLLLGVADNPESLVFRSRLRNAIALAVANGQHVPLRQILTLVVNIVLGDSENRDMPLLTCEMAYQRVKKGRQYRKTNPYDNAVGINLSEDTRNRYVIFSTLEAFGIGFETTNQFDELILHQRPNDIAQRLKRVDPVYGEAIFRDLRITYIKGPREEVDMKKISLAMASQRRRLFFQLSDEETNRIGTVWLLTVFHNGEEYLEFKKQVSEAKMEPSANRIMQKIVMGFNRAITGLMTDDSETLWVAGPVGKSDDQTGRITTVGGISRISSTSLFHLEVSHDERRKRPKIEVKSQLQGIQDKNLPDMDVKPLLFEYLLRVADGSLPLSFSRECHQEVKHFRDDASAKDCSVHTPQVKISQLKSVKILSLDDDAAIKRSNIEVS